MEKVRLFCIPYAGGSAMAYSNWKKISSENVEICPIELPGRGRRSKQSLAQSMAEVVEDVFRQLQEQIDGPYAIFGHSMGSLITYEVCQRLLREGVREPLHVFFSGRKPPHLGGGNLNRHKLPEPEFIAEVLKYGGTSKSVFENEMLRVLFLPILRADFKIIETYEYEPSDRKLNCPVSAFMGDGDEEMTWSDVLAWGAYTSHGCSCHKFSGSHFFLNEVTEQVVHTVCQTLMGAVSEAPQA